METITDAYAVRKAAETQESTWGHLMAKGNMPYTGYILYTVGKYGDAVCIAAGFVNLKDSPWFYDDLHDFMGSNGEEDGTTYLFAGTYCRGRGRKFMGRFKQASCDAMLQHFGKIEWK